MSVNRQPLFAGTWFRRVFPPWVLAVMGWANVVAVVAGLYTRRLEGGPLFGAALCGTLYLLMRRQAGGKTTGGRGQGEPSVWRPLLPTPHSAIRTRLRVTHRALSLCITGTETILQAIPFDRTTGMCAGGHMDRHEKVNIALGVVGSITMVTAALVTASHHQTFACVMLAILANLWIGRTSYLVRRVRNRAVEQRAAAATRRSLPS